MRRLTLAALAAVAASVTMAACGSPATVDRGSTTAPAVLTARDAQRWAKQWCTVQPGDRQAFVRVLMGTPTASYAGQDQWEGFGYSFTAFYDERGRVTQLQLSDVRMTGRQRRAIRCNEVRS